MSRNPRVSPGSSVEKFEAIHVFEIEIERALAAVDFESDVILAAVGKACGFEVGDGAVLEASDPGNGVVDGDRPGRFPAFAPRPAPASSRIGRFLMKVSIRAQTSLISPTR